MSENESNGNGYSRRYVHLPDEVWGRLDALVEGKGRTVTADFFIGLAVDDMLNQGTPDATTPRVGQIMPDKPKRATVDAATV